MLSLSSTYISDVRVSSSDARFLCADTLRQSLAPDKFEELVDKPTHINKQTAGQWLLTVSSSSTQQQG